MTKHLRLLAIFIVIILLSIFTTSVSYLIVTGRNVPMAEDLVSWGERSLTGKYLVTLPCDRFSDSSKPTQPETRGIPLNYNYYSPCDGHQILRKNFLLDIIFWTVIFWSLFLVYSNRQRKRISAKRVH
jgi:hypothetical protein